MNKTKKIIILSFFIAIFSLCFLFIKPISSYGIKTVLNGVSKSVLKGAKVSFKDFEMKNKKVVLRDVKISNKKCQIALDKLDINLEFKIFKPKIIADIFVEKPHVTLFKNEKWTFNLPKKKRGLLSCLIKVDKGSIDFAHDSEIIKTIHFDYTNHILGTSNSKLDLFLEENFNKKVSIDISNTNIFSTHLDEVDISNIGVILNFFGCDLFQDLKGLVNGIVVLGVEKNKIHKFFTNLDFVNLSFLSPKTFLSFDCKIFKIETSYPDFFTSNKVTLLDSIKYDFLKKAKIRLNFEELTLLTSRRSIFSKIDGSFSYNPNLGSKLNILGKIENEKAFDFQINSKAYTASNFSNWLDLECFIDNKSTKISLHAKEVDDYYNLHLSFENIKAHIFEAFQDLLYKSYDQISDFKYLDGNVSFCLDSRFNEKGFNKVFITDLSLKDVKCQKGKIKGFISKIEGKSSFDISNKNFLDKFFADIKISKSSFDIDQKKIKDFEAKIFALDGSFQSSSLACLIENIETKAEIKGPIKEFTAKVSSKGSFSDFDDTFLSEVVCKRKDKEFHFSGNLSISDNQAAVFGFDLKKLLIFSFLDLKNNLKKGWLRAEKIQISKWPKILGLDLLIDGKANIAAFYNNDKLSFQIKGENLSFKNPYIDLKIDKIGNLNDFVFEGDKFISAVLDKKLLNCQFPTFTGKCFLPKFESEFDLKEANIKIDKNVLKAKLKSESEKVDLDGMVLFDFSKKYPLLNVETNFSSTICSLQNLLKHFGFSNDLNLLGIVSGNSKISTYFDEDIQNYYSLNFKFEDASYKINEKTSLANIQANAFLSSDDTLIFSKAKGALKLGNKTYLVSMPIFQKIKDKLDFDIRLEKDIFDFLRLKGNFIKKDDKYQLSIDKENSHLVGKKFQVLDFLMDENFNIDKFKLISHIDSFAFISSCQFLLDFGFLWDQRINILSLIQSKHSGDLKASVTLDENKDLAFDIVSNNFQFLDNKFKKFSLKGKKAKSNLEIHELIFDDFESSIFVDIESDKLKIKDCNIKKKDELFLKMKGSYERNLATLVSDISDIKIDLKKIRPLISNFFALPKISIEGHLKGGGIFSFQMPKNDEKFNFSMNLDFYPSNLTIEKIRLYNSGPLNVHVTSNAGFIIQGLDFSFYSKDIDLSYLTCKISKASFDLNSKSYLFKDTNINIPQSLKSSFEKVDNLKPIFEIFKLTDDIDLTCDIQFSSDLSNIELFSKKANFVLNNKKQEIKDIFLNFREKKCFFNFDYLYKDTYFTIKNDFQYGRVINAKTTFLESETNLSKPLKISWILDENNKFLVKEITGYFSGADFLFQEDLDKINSNNLFGSIKLDGSKLKKILPENIEKSIDHFLIGSGFEISGKLGFDFSKPSFINFEGLFSGKDFDLFSYQFKTMFSKLTIADSLVKFSDFKISDGAGILTINELNLQKNKNKWQLFMPTLKIKDLRPSLLQKVNEPLDEITPFLVRELVLKDFKGDLNDKNSFTGQGDFHFINSFKRGQSIFDFPADVLSRIVGIDQELLTPVKGKVDFFVKNGKFNFSKLTDSFSEAERSKFFLLDKGQKPYVDFDGNIYINIAMKQYVLFKFTESFVISIRGKLEDPQCNLKKKRGFLN